MDINEVYGDSKWLRAVDLQGRKVRVTIENWDVTEFKQLDGSTRDQIILTFSGKEKKLGLNVTNCKMIASMHGNETDGWIGKEILLFPTKILDSRTGNMVDCIRVEYEARPAKAKIIQQTSTRATPRAAVKTQETFDERNPPPSDDIPEHHEFYDEIPF
jgi:hypothetical protein